LSLQQEFDPTRPSGERVSQLKYYIEHFYLLDVGLITYKLRSCLVQLLNPCKTIMVVSKVKTNNFNMFGSASQNQFSSPKAIMVEAIIPSF